MTLTSAPGATYGRAMTFHPLHLARVASPAAAVVALLAASSAHAAVCPPAATSTYTGPAGGTWNSAANWSGNALRTTASIACIPEGKGTVGVPAGVTANASLLTALSPISIPAGAKLNLA